MARDEEQVAEAAGGGVGEQLPGRSQAAESPDHRGAGRAAFLQLLAQQDDRTDGRRERLSEANRLTVPTPVWFFLGFGAFVTIGFAFFFADRREGFIVRGA